MISIITITYNRKLLLKKAIDSVLSQSFADFEYIIVDDGSIDGTENLIKEYSDKRIKYITNTHTGILTLTRNIGINNAKGEIITFLDSDDYWHEDYLKNVIEVYHTKNIIATISNGFVVGNSNYDKKTILNFKKIRLLTGYLIKQSLLNDYHIMYPSCFTYKKNNLKFDENLKWGENDFFNRILAEGNSTFLMDEFVYIQKHNENISSIQTEDSLFIQAYNEEFHTLKYLRQTKKISNYTYRKAYSKYLIKQAYSYKIIKLNSKANINALNAFLLNPFNFKSIIKYLIQIK